MQVMIFIVLAGIAFGAIRFSEAVYGDKIAPLGMFYGVTLISLALHHLELLPLTPISLQAYMMIVFGLFSFLVGALLATPTLLRGRRVPTADLYGRKVAHQPRGLATFFYFTATLATIGWIIGVVLFGWEYSLSQIFLEPSLLQHSFQRQYVGYLNMIGILVAPTFVLLALARRRVTVSSVFFLTSAQVGLVLAGIKYYLIFSLITALLVWSAARPGRVRFWYIAVCALGGILFMAAYNHYIDIFMPKTLAGSRFPDMLAFLEQPYLYIVGSWSAMSALMESPIEQPVPGLLSLHFIWKILGSGLSVIEPVPDYEPFLDIGPSIFNVYSLIGSFYWDYGPVGVILGCFILGYIATLLYVKARRSGRWWHHLVAAVFSYGLFLSFFGYVYRFEMVFLLVYVIAGGGISMAVLRPRRQPCPSLICGTFVHNYREDKH